MQYLELRRIALEKFGRAAVRPQQVDLDFLKYRRSVNFYDFHSIKLHPYSNNIDLWCVKSSQVVQRVSSADFTPRWVNSVSDLEKLGQELLTHTVITVGFEGNNDHCYSGMTCLMQISTHKYNYLIDTLRLYSHINRCLGPIFSSEGIIKIVLGGTDLLDLQRDYLIYCQATIDIQELYHALNPDKYQISFKDLVFDLLSEEVDKSAQLADWRVRPLPLEMQEYAVKDSALLYIAFDELLTRLNLNGFDITSFGFPRSKKEMLKLYHPRTTDNSTKIWRTIVDALPATARAIFDVPSQEQLSWKLFNWRDDYCREYDISRNYFIKIQCSNDNLAFITRAMPTTVSYLNSLVPTSKKWKHPYINQLFTLIKSHGKDKQPELIEMWDDAPQLPPPVNVEPEDMVFEIQNDQEVNISVNDKPSSSSKGQRNRLKRLRLWQNRRTKNLARLTLDLPPIKYKRNRGIKDREFRAHLRQTLRDFRNKAA